MKLLSVNVGLPRPVPINGRSVLTGIDKQPVAGPVWLGRLTLAGDGQADLQVHGGEFQAAYSYPGEHYAHWERFMGVTSYPPGTFGENFTTSGLLEDTVCVGDVWRIGGATVQVTIPRFPCFKFAHKIGSSEILKPFLASGRSGFYHRVIEEGPVQAGDGIRILDRDARAISVRQMLGLMKLGEGDATLVQRALAIPGLPPVARQSLEARLTSFTGPE